MKLPLCAVLLASLAVPGWTQEPARKTTTPTVVFVCEHGSAKSVIASRYFDRMARERGINVQSIARGANPDSEIGPVVRKGLLSDGIDVGNFSPKRVAGPDLESARIVISFGPDLKPPSNVRMEHWDETPGPSENYRAARDYIVRRVQKLLDELQAKR